jgi:2-hydroxymuconate-semialdehyde hydrolase
VLLVHGAEDRVTPMRTSALHLLEHVTDVRLHVFLRCAHVPAVEHPHDSWRLLSGFLRQE